MDDVKGKGISTIYHYVFPNGKHYVGQTWYTLDERAGKGGSKYKKQPLLFRAIEKYGWENVKTEVVCLAIDQQDANFWEKHFIIKFDSMDPNKGYNCTDGGYDGFPSEATRKKLSEGQLGEKNHMFGKKRSDEAKRKTSEAVRCENNPRYGAVVSEETRAKIGDGNRGKVRTPEHCNIISETHKDKPKTEEHRKKISEANTGKVFTEEHRNNLSIAQKKAAAERKAKREAMAPKPSDVK